MIKKLDKNHIVEIHDILKKMFKNHAESSNWGMDWNQSSLQSALDLGKGVGLFDENKLISFIFYRELTKDLKDIILLGTCSNYQGKGYMSQLFRHLQVQYNRSEWWLEVHESNLKAQKLYAKLGFVQVGLREEYYSDKKGAIQYALGP